MMRDILFLLWLFIVPAFTIGHRYFKYVKLKLPAAHKKVPLNFIVRFTIFGWLFMMFTFLTMFIILWSLFSELPLFKGILVAQIIIFHLVFLSPCLELQQSIFKRLFLGFSLVLNAILMVIYLINHDFSTALMVIIVLAYPVVFWYQLLGYTIKDEK